MSAPHESEGFVSTPLEVRELAEKIIITRKARRTKFVSARLTMSAKGSKRILLESLEIDEQDITLGVIRQKVLHHAEDSLRDVQRTYLSSR